MGRARHQAAGLSAQAVFLCASRGGEVCAVWPPHPPAGTFSPRGEGEIPQRLRSLLPGGEKVARRVG